MSVSALIAWLVLMVMPAETPTRVTIGSMQQDGWQLTTGAGATFMTHGRWFGTIKSLEEYRKAQRSGFSE